LGLRTKKKADMGKRKPDQRQPRVMIEGEVLRQIRQHARSNSKTEVCGVLIGEEIAGGVSITARIPGLNAAQAGTYVTFTQDTWEHIYKIKDKDYPDQRIVGWYHSHPGFGVFLSDHDTFIHKNFFSSPLQVAWVYDPHSDEEGCFGWAGERLERVSEIHLKDDKGGEEAGETGKPEPVGGIEEDENIDEETVEIAAGAPGWLKWTLMIASYTLLAAIVFVASQLFFPHEVILVIDPLSGMVRQGHISRDGNTIEVPGMPPIEIRHSDRMSSPSSLPQSAPPATPSEPPKTAQPQPSTKPGDGKDQNVPRK
jgi:proteasome lid subunit RPN8/RPN11